MFAKELPKALTQVRHYKLFYKHTQEWAFDVMINVNHVSKISLLRNTIIFHLPTHNQVIEYINPLDAEKEYHNIHVVLNQ